MQDIKVALAGAGAFGIKHLDGIKQIDGVEVVSLVSRELDKTKEVAAEVRHRPRDDRPRRQPGAEGGRCRDPVHADADARRADASQCMKAGKHVQVEIPLADSLKDAQAVVALQKADRPGRDVRPHAPLQSQPPVRAQEDRGRRVQHPADGRADLFLPPQQHERAGPAAQLDRPPAVAPRRAHGRPVRLPVRQPDREGQRGAGPDPSDAGHRDGHEHPAQGGQRRDLHAVAVASTTTARSAPSSATSATPAPTSRATTTCSTARKRRSTSPRWTCR